MYDSFGRRGDSGKRRKPGRREFAICNVSEAALFSSPHLPLSDFVRSACPTTCLFPTSLRVRACLVLASRFSMFSLFAGMSTLDGARFQRPIAFDCSLFLYSAGFQVGLGMILGCFPPIGGVFAPLLLGWCRGSFQHFSLCVLFASTPSPCRFSVLAWRDVCHICLFLLVRAFASFHVLRGMIRTAGGLFLDKDEHQSVSPRHRQ